MPVEQPTWWQWLIGAAVATIVYGAPTVCLVWGIIAEKRAKPTDNEDRTSWFNSQLQERDFLLALLGLLCQFGFHADYGHPITQPRRTSE